MGDHCSGELNNLLEMFQIIPDLQHLLHVFGFLDDEDVGPAVVEDELVHGDAVRWVNPNSLKLVLMKKLSLL